MIDIGTLRTYDNEYRAYIGASGIGDPCNAYQVLCLRGFPSAVPSAKLVRIFRDGKRIEDQVVADMRDAGLMVLPVDPATGRQYRYTKFNGHMSASLDGYVIAPSGETMTLEIKSMNKAMFAKFVNKGLAVSHESYVAQMIVGMGLARDAGVSVSNGLMVAYCKDNSEYHTEVIGFNQEAYDKAVLRVSSLISGESPARRISPYKAAFTCSGCFKAEACWEPEKVEPKTCKQCKYASLDSECNWVCDAGKQFGAICGMFGVFKVTPNGR